jgi:hypothetical protein
MNKEIYKMENESNIVYQYRKDFVDKNLDKFLKDNVDYNTIIKYSKMLANMKFKKCKYDNIIYKQLKQYL